MVSWPCARTGEEGDNDAGGSKSNPLLLNDDKADFPKFWNPNCRLLHRYRYNAAAQSGALTTKQARSQTFELLDKGSGHKMCGHIAFDIYIYIYTQIDAH